MKIGAGAFLAGASGRLLPASIPFRFFGAAVAYHLLAWLALLAGAGAAPRFAGGLGWPLAALHLATLGVLAMSAMGASLQLLPVATRQPISAPRWTVAVWWVYTPGVAVAALGMGLPSPALLAAGAIAIVTALACYALLLGWNLLGARGMPGVVAHGWAAFFSLLVVLATGASLAGSYLGAAVIGRETALALHVGFAAYGFMGMLALGLSYILVPMFALSPAPSERLVLLSFGCGAAGLALLAASAFVDEPRALRIGAIAAAMLAVALHLHLMRKALRAGMRRELGRSFLLVRIAWAMLAASLLVALAQALGAPFGATGTLFVAALVAGWLLTFLLGILQRIVPFLASMHAAPGRRAPPTPSGLTTQGPLDIHLWCHVGAVALLALGIVLDNAWIVRAAAATGVVGAAAFGVFFAVVLRRMGRPRVRTGPAPVA